jgi:hypothetical protein
MKPLYALLVCSSLALAQREVLGTSIGIVGLNNESTSGIIRTSRLENNKLNLETSAGQISILGYPTWLETQKLIGANLSATQRLRPDGAETRLEFSKGKTPFLVIGSSTRPNSVLIGNWRFALKISEKSAFVNLEPQSISLPLEKNMLVKQGLLLWCVRLAALHLPTPSKPNLANETETPRFDWAALRVSRATQCQN